MTPGQMRGYGASFMFACAGVTWTVITLASLIYAREGRDPLHAMDAPAILGFLYLWPLSFAMVLSLSKVGTPAMRRRMLGFLRLNMVAALAGTVVALVMMVCSPPGTNLDWSRWFFGASCLCHVATLVWLFVYSRLGEARDRA